MGMHKNFMDILNVLYFDETLLRLLYYPPLNLTNKTPDPLDPSLDNVSVIDPDYEIRYSRIMKTPKDDDLIPDNPICRMIIYAGIRTPDNGNYAMANQEIIIDIFVHNSFEEGDLRSKRISDRLYELFVSEKVTGIGKMEYKRGVPFNSPSGYMAFQHVFKITEFKK
jgi:hypothetical protein